MSLQTDEDLMKLLVPYNNIKGDKYENTANVLKRVILSALIAISLNFKEDVEQQKFLIKKLFSKFPAGTIFTRTCKDSRTNKRFDPTRSGGFCGFDLKGTTTFANFSPLANLNIRNKSNHQNDSVVFLKSTRDMCFIDFTIISQIIGVQIKSGVSAINHKDSRGIFSACCPNYKMIEVCKFFNCDGIIQTDSADALINMNEEEEYKSIIPKTVDSGVAFPLFNKNNELAGAIFPEIAFYSDNLSEILEYVNGMEYVIGTTPDQYASDNRREIRRVIDPIFRFGQPLFPIQQKRQIDKNLILGVDEYNYDIFSLDEILRDPKSRHAYFNFQLNKFPVRTPITDHTSYLQKYIVRKTLINNVFKNSNFNILPYLTDDDIINHGLLRDFCNNLIGDLDLEAEYMNSKDQLYKFLYGAGKKKSTKQKRLHNSSKKIQKKKTKKRKLTQKYKRKYCKHHNKKRPFKSKQKTRGRKK